MKMRVIFTVICFITSVNCVIGGLNVNSKHITLSGFSSGGTFAQHFQFSYSSLFDGIAVFSHSYYRCSSGNGKVLDYDTLCTKQFNLKEKQYYNPELVHNDISTYHRNNQIEDPSQLKNKRLYVYTGVRSFLFTPAMSLNILRVYERYILNINAIHTRVQDADLVLPTYKKGIGSCTKASRSSVFVGSCGFSGAFEALSFLLPDKVINEPTDGKSIQLQPLQEFDQTKFFSGIKDHHMDTIGFFYIPKECKSDSQSRCLLHFYFHGCWAGREFNGTKHIEYSGFLEVAELNNIIIIFPQTVSSLPQNRIGCWDTFGISGPLYATKEGAQVKVVKNILDKILNGGSLPIQNKILNGTSEEKVQTNQSSRQSRAAQE